MRLLAYAALLPPFFAGPTLAAAVAPAPREEPALISLGVLAAFTAQGGEPAGADASRVLRKMRTGVCVNFNLVDPYVELAPAERAQNLYLDTIRAAGFTAIRQFFNSNRPAPSYDDMVRAALQRDLVVNLCMFAWPGTTQEQFVAKWREIALHFREQPSDLVFELMNEPMLAPKIRETEIVMDWISAAVIAIREISPTRILLVGGPQFMQANWLKEVNPERLTYRLPGGGGFREDPNLFGAFHMYEPHGYTMPKGQRVTLGDLPNWQRIVTFVIEEAAQWSKQWGKPVVLTEWAAQNDLKTVDDFLQYTKFVAAECRQRNIATFYYCGVPDNRMVWSILNTERGWYPGVLELLTGATAPLPPPLNQIVNPEFARKGAWGFSDAAAVSTTWINRKNALLLTLSQSSQPVSIWQDASTASERTPAQQGGMAGGHLSGAPLFLRADSAYAVRVRAQAKNPGAMLTVQLTKPEEQKPFFTSAPQPLGTAAADHVVNYTHSGGEVADVRLSLHFTGDNNEVSLHRVTFTRHPKQP